MTTIKGLLQFEPKIIIIKKTKPRTLTQCDLSEEISPDLLEPELHLGSFFSPKGYKKSVHDFIRVKTEAISWRCAMLPLLLVTDPARNSSLVLVEALDLRQVCGRRTLDLETFLRKPTLKDSAGYKLIYLGQKYMLKYMCDACLNRLKNIMYNAENKKKL